jgi:Notch-like protein
MASSCVPAERCGTAGPGWMKGTHPTVADGKVTRKVCYTWEGDCCIDSNNIKVVNCGQYYVYKLSPPPSGCDLRYCGSDN